MGILCDGIGFELFVEFDGVGDFVGDMFDSFLDFFDEDIVFSVEEIEIVY